MIPWVELGRAAIPGEDRPLVLARRGGEYVIRIGPTALMGSRAHGSEEALAELACRPLSQRPGARVLVGGLGMGFTLAAVLRELRPDARVRVAELLPAVVEWNRDWLAHLAGRPLDDPRVSLVVDDVGAAIRAARGAWDAILLDVDNGPNGLTRAGNDALYSARGLRSARVALRPGGVLGVWSVAADATFARRLEAAGFAVAESAVRARRTRGGRHTLWIATRPIGRGPPA
jgi:spermidine synthase